MNNRLEARDLLAWLLQDLDPTIAAPSGESGPDTGSEGLGDNDLQVKTLDTLDNEVNVQGHNLEGSGEFLFEQTQRFEPGDRFAVQDRFHALLKRRLRSEIDRNPPLFPWETEPCDYEAEELAIPRFAAPSFWAAQLTQLNLPVPLPERVLEELLTRCQCLVQGSLQEGVKLVQAVESLFPGQSQSLNQLAGMVLAAPARSGNATAEKLVISGSPSHYDAANPAQQMALSLLAAREIFDSLTLSITPEQPVIERRWLTPAGELTLKADRSVVGRLRVEALLPCAGKIQLGDEQANTQAQRASEGLISVELPNPDLSRVYPLQVSLSLAEQPALVFAIQLAD